MPEFIPCVRGRRDSTGHPQKIGLGSIGCCDTQEAMELSKGKMAQGPKVREEEVELCLREH